MFFPRCRLCDKWMSAGHVASKAHILVAPPNEHFDESLCSGRVFYTAADRLTPDQAANSALQAPPTIAPVPPALTLPAGWHVAYDPEGRPYYYHESTRVPQWTSPACAPQISALPAGWRVAYSPESRPYFYDESTRVAQWTPPS